MDKRDWEFVQSVFDYIETYKEKTYAVEKAIKGVVPKSVEAAPIMTKYGTFKGGYYPLSYDSDKSFRVSQDDANAMADSMTNLLKLYTLIMTQPAVLVN